MLARGASGAIVLYDVTRRSSFVNLDRFFSILDRETTTVMLGNKCDMTDKREDTKEEGEKLASEKGIKFIETSAKNDVNVEEAFTILVKDMLLRREFKSFQEFITSSEVSSNTLYVNTAKTGPNFIGSNALVANTNKMGPKFVANSPKTSALRIRRFVIY